MRNLAILLLALSVLVAAGCASKKVSTAEAAPFAAAIDDYLAAASFGMKIDRFESLTIDGDKALAAVRMADKEAGYGLRQVWEFTFQKTGGAWKVVGLKRD